MHTLTPEDASVAVAYTEKFPTEVVEPSITGVLPTQPAFGSQVQSPPFMHLVLPSADRESIVSPEGQNSSEIFLIQS